MSLILILSDDSSLLNHLGQILRKVDEVRSEHATLSSAAIKSINQLAPDIIIIGLTKKLKPPIVNLLESIRPSISRIVISSTSTIDAYNFAKRINANSFFSSNVDEYILQYSIEQLLEKKKGAIWKIPDGRSTHFLDSEMINWIKTEGNYSSIYHNDKITTIRKSLKNIEAELKSTGLIKIHRSVLINPIYISEIRYSDSLLIMKNGEELPIGRSYKKLLQEYQVI